MSVLQERKRCASIARFAAQHAPDAARKSVAETIANAIENDAIGTLSDDALMMAPGATDLTFGSLLDFMIGCSFQRVETLASDRKHRFYTECRCCGGTDEKRDHYKTSPSKVEHSETCGFRKHMVRLRAMADKGVT